MSRAQAFSGSAAVAWAALVRNEMVTGLPTGGTFHSIKAQETVSGLQRWLRNNPGASYSDRLVARSLLDDLLDTLGGGL